MYTAGEMNTCPDWKIKNICALGQDLYVQGMQARLNVEPCRCLGSIAAKALAKFQSNEYSNFDTVSQLLDFAKSPVFWLCQSFNP